jgi:hypothetical protein
MDTSPSRNFLKGTSLSINSVRVFHHQSILPWTHDHRDILSMVLHQQSSIGSLLLTREKAEISWRFAWFMKNLPLSLLTLLLLFLIYPFCYNSTILLLEHCDFVNIQ